MRDPGHFCFYLLVLACHRQTNIQPPMWAVFSYILRIVNVASSISDQVTLRVYRRIRCQVVCLYAHILCCTLLPPDTPPLSSTLLNLPNASPCLRVNVFFLPVAFWGFAQLPRLFPLCSIVLAAAWLSHPRIIFCPLYSKSVQEHCAFSFTVNIVTALTKESQA